MIYVSIYFPRIKYWDCAVIGMNVQSMLTEELLSKYKAKLLQLKKGEIIYAVGERPKFVYVVKSGAAKFSYFNREGKEFVYAIMGANEIFGYSFALHKDPTVATCTTIEPTQLWAIPHEEFTKLLQENPTIMFSLLQEVVSRLMQMTAQLGEMAVEDAEFRLSNLMNYYKEKRGIAKDREYVVPLTRQQLADMTGLRVETVIRTIKAMEQKGLLEIIEGKIFWTPRRSPAPTEESFS